jgi:monofunctional glycosyltransferase
VILLKFIRRLFLLIVLIIIIVGSVFYINGNKLYKESIAQTSISDKVSQIREDENFTSINDVPAYYKNAIVAVEDHRFYNHGTIDPIALARATVSNIKQKDFKEGGSTLTQQTAKNLYFISEDEVINRKIAEVLVGIDLEKDYSKDEILELYFNTIYFGDGYYGIKEACNGYLKKEPKDMTLSDATLLAGIPNAPSVYAPTKNPDLAIKRQKKVISSMVEYGYLSQEEADAIK